MNKITIDVDDLQLQQVNYILEDLGLDINSVVKICMNRIVKEGSILFLLSKTKEDPIIIPTKKDHSEIIVTKNKAIRLFVAKGQTFQGEITFASKNKSVDNYWANPDFAFLDEDWSLILNDWINRKLYLFQIPKNTFSKEDFVKREDRSYKMDIQIMYDDPTFTDNRSSISFRNYLVDTVEY